jgi:hypothetical protein
MIALRLRKRRDGSLCLTDVDGRTSGNDRYFPEDHYLTFDFLARNSSIITMTDTELKLSLANAEAVYEIISHDPDGVSLHLTKSSLSEPAPIDEHVAAALATNHLAVAEPGRWSARWRHPARR